MKQCVSTFTCHKYELVDSASMILDPLWIGDAYARYAILIKTRHNCNHLYPGVIGLSVKLVA